MLNNWHAKVIDFDQACTQEHCDACTYLCLPVGFYANNRDRDIVELIKSMHGFRQGGCNFYEKLKSEFENEAMSN